MATLLLQFSEKVRVLPSGFLLPLDFLPTDPKRVHHGPDGGRVLCFFLHCQTWSHVYASKEQKKLAHLDVMFIWWGCHLDRKFYKTYTKITKTSSLIFDFDIYFFSVAFWWWVQNPIEGDKLTNGWKTSDRDGSM